MLQELHIRNYALIEALELSFDKGFSVITGETGAGKSILLGALALVLGKRADVKVLRNPAEKCIVEAHFLLDAALKGFFDEHDLDFERVSLLRREIAPSGKSRAFINDTPVTLNVLNALAFSLIDVHSQHETILLTDTGFQMALLDGFAHNAEVLSAYQKTYASYRELEDKIYELDAFAAKEAGDADYLQFLFDELEEAQLQEGEVEALEEELEALSHADEIKHKLSTVVQLLYTEELGAYTQAQQAQQQLASLAQLKGPYATLGERLNSLGIELDDMRMELEELAENTMADPLRAEQLSARLNKLFALQKKHQVSDVAGLLHKKEALEQKVLQLSTLEENRKALEKRHAESLERVKKQALVLSARRREAAEALSAEICGMLSRLNMPGAQLHMHLEHSDKFTRLGADQLLFKFSANKGQAVQALSKVASGGELSRVMLAIKAIMAKSKNLPTIIFDEIDAGVSGETAGSIGEILSTMGHMMQVVAITHLPQIAAKGKRHYKVLKETAAGQTHTRLIVLDEKQREMELARLLSGARISEAALENAREMLAR